MEHSIPADPKPEDLLLIWNRYSDRHLTACRFEAAGATVLVGENGYFSPTGSPKWEAAAGPRPQTLYALAEGYHNDQLRTWAFDSLRFEKLGVTLQPWRKDGRHILVAGNRPFGPPDRAMPANWPEEVASRIRRYTNREIRVRVHPGNIEPRARPLEADLENAWATVIWSSSAGLYALARGIPTFCEGPRWICKTATLPDISEIETFSFTERWQTMGADLARRRAFESMAWGQFTLSEIESGWPFKMILRNAELWKESSRQYAT